MKMRASSTPVLKDLVLLGGGHSHIETLRSLGMRPVPGVRLTLVSRDIHTPYSGMLPGYVSGFYAFDDCHVDLSQLAKFAGATLVHAEAIHIDPQVRELRFGGRPPMRYDLLSVDIGITPGVSSVPGASKFTTTVKPISRLVDNLEEVLKQAREKALKLAIIGGGAGGVELTLALQHRLEEERKAADNPSLGPCTFSLITRTEILTSHPKRARKIFTRIMAERGIKLVENCGGVARVEDGVLHLENGATEEFDICWWCTDASAAPWLAQTGLATDASGFIAINDCLQSESHSDVFAAGDIASCAAHPRPKAGVFAVRQGPPLTENIRRRLAEQPLLPFVPQSTFLTLLATGDRYAVGSKGSWCFEAGILWRLKDYIDRAFMRKYSTDLPSMDEDEGDAEHAKGVPSVATGAEALAAVAGSRRMRCGGCGAKVGASVLSRVLGRLKAEGYVKTTSDSDILLGLDSPDDAAVVRSPGPGMVSVRTVDFFRDFVGDPFIFGRIAANHALSDCQAMGAQPQTALAIAVVPFGLPSKTEETLFQMMAGASQVLEDAGCALVGGHSGEGSEMALGFSIDGTAPEASVVRKSGLSGGQALLLTKGIGTGAILAAWMARSGGCQGRWVSGALDSMQQSSAAAVECLQKHGATACTDVTGFGLLGHLVEMARPHKVAVEIDFDAIPLLDGADVVAAAGVTSSLHAENLRAVEHMVNNPKDLKKRPHWSLLIDPQTAGGMLASLPMAQAEDAVAELRKLGYVKATIIGSVLPLAEGNANGDHEVTGLVNIKYNAGSS